MQSVLYGATVVPVKGSYDDAFLLSIEYTKHFGGINRNTAYNPMTIEGKKSVSIELFEQLGRKAPDVVYVPVGDGCIISGVYKGFYDLMQAGLIKRIPYIVCSQSQKSNAISMAFETGEFRSISATTRADSISVDIPASGRMAVQYLRQYGGWCSQVSEEEILDAQMTLVHDSGIFVEPASATAWAAMNKDSDMLKKRFDYACKLLETTNYSIKTLASLCGYEDFSQFSILFKKKVGVSARTYRKNATQSL